MYIWKAYGNLYLYFGGNLHMKNMTLLPIVSTALHSYRCVRLDLRFGVQTWPNLHEIPQNMVVFGLNVTCAIFDHKAKGNTQR
jgi:hypothetical protein